MNNNDENYECLICLERNCVAYQPPCGHEFCSSCLPKVTNRKCPLCRSPLPGTIYDYHFHVYPSLRGVSRHHLQRDFPMLCRQGNLADIQTWVTVGGVNVQTPGGHSETALRRSAEAGHLAVVQYLVAQNAEVNQGNCSHQSPPLFCSAAAGKVTVVQWLIEQRANIHRTDALGNTPLMIACLNYQPAIVEYLLSRPEHTRDLVNHTTNRGANALNICAVKNYVDLSRRLLDHNATINVRTLGISSTKGNLAMVKLCLEYGDVDINALDQGRTPLQNSTLAGHEAIVQYLITQNARVNLSTPTGQTALYFSCLGNYTAIAHYLLEHSADVNALDHQHHSVLLKGCQYGAEAIVRLLLSHRANVNQANIYGTTPLCISAQEGHTGIVRMLVHHQAHVNQAEENQGMTPLYLSALRGHESSVRELLHVQANIDQANHQHETPLLAAVIRAENLDIMRLLLAHGAKVDGAPRAQITPLFICVLRGNIESVRILLDHQADINRPCINQQSPFVAAIRQHQLAAVQCLVESSNVNLNKIWLSAALPSITTLYLAVLEKNKVMARYFIDHGVDIELTRTTLDQNHASCPWGIELLNELLSENEVN